MKTTGCRRFVLLVAIGCLGVLEVGSETGYLKVIGPPPIRYQQPKLSSLDPFILPPLPAAEEKSDPKDEVAEGDEPVPAAVEPSDEPPTWLYPLEPQESEMGPLKPAIQPGAAEAGAPETSAETLTDPTSSNTGEGPEAGSEFDIDAVSEQINRIEPSVREPSSPVPLQLLLRYFSLSPSNHVGSEVLAPLHFIPPNLEPTPSRATYSNERR